MLKRRDNISYRKLALVSLLSIILVYTYKTRYEAFISEVKYSKLKELYDLSLGDIYRGISTHEDQSANLKQIKAKSYLVYDLTSNQIILGSDEKAMMPLASVTKLMTALVALTECRDNLKEELDLLLIASDNSVADSIANNCPNYADFIDKMNVYAKKNNLSMTFANPSGLDYENPLTASNFGDAVSVAKLLELLYLKDNGILKLTTLNNFQNIHNTNNHIDKFPFIIGSKTGYTDVAGGNLATLYEISPSHRVAIVVLASTREDRFSDTFILLNSYLDNAE